MQNSTLTIDTSLCKYDIVKECAESLGFTLLQSSSLSLPLLTWLDTGVSFSRVLRLLPFQRINHFAGMHELCNKDNLARNLLRLHKSFPNDYDFSPKTWIMPLDWKEWESFVQEKKSGKADKSDKRDKRVFIVKPKSSCQGKGIYLTTFVEKMEQGMIVQEYIQRPLLLGGYKFDFRVYVLVTRCDPLRLFIHKQGLARFATKKYNCRKKRNLREVCMHLTNYAINKQSDDFKCPRDGDGGSKRTMASVFDELRAKGCDVDGLWNDMTDTIVKTIISAQPILARIHQTCFPNRLESPCFEILGFDILLDSVLKPWILEVNHSPSFSCDAEIDRQVKGEVIGDAIRLLGLRGDEEMRYSREEKARIRYRLSNGGKEERRDSEGYFKQLENMERVNCGGYQRIYPCEDVERMKKYEQFIEKASEIFTDTPATKARQEKSRLKEKVGIDENLKRRSSLYKHVGSKYALAKSCSRELPKLSRSLPVVSLRKDMEVMELPKVTFSFEMFDERAQVKSKD